MEENQAASTEAENTEAVEAKEKEDVAVNEQPAEAAQPEQQQQAATAKKDWRHTVNLVATILIIVAGFVSVIFMTFLSYSVKSNVIGIKNANYGVGGLTDKMQELLDSIAESQDEKKLLTIISSLFSFLYEVITAYVAILLAVIFGIILIVKTVKTFTGKKDGNADKWAITCFLFFVAFAILFRSFAQNFETNATNYAVTVDGKKDFIKVGYSGATTAGLVIGGICFALYAIAKLAINFKKYFGEKGTIINGSLNLGWLVITLVVFCLVAACPIVVSYSSEGVKVNASYNLLACFTTGLEQVAEAAYNGNADAIEEFLVPYSNVFGYSMVGIVIQIWLIFQTGKALHGALDGTVNADAPVKLGSQIFRVILSLFYMIFTIVVAKNMVKILSNDYVTYKASLAIPVVIFVFAVLSLVLSIVNKVLAKNKQQM